MLKPAVMWFRQDLRLADNAALRAAAEAGPLICLDVLDDVTLGEWTWGGASRWWMHKSLARLQEDLARFKVSLILRRGAADKVIADVLRETRAASLHFTRDYAPWSGALERRIKAAAETESVGCHRHGGFLLHEPEAIRTDQGGALQGLHALFPGPVSLWVTRGRRVRRRGRSRPGRRYWLQVAKGALDVNGRPVMDGDGLAIVKEQSLAIRATSRSEILLFDLQ